jgi:hypothetical protein
MKSPIEHFELKYIGAVLFDNNIISSLVIDNFVVFYLSSILILIYIKYILKIKIIPSFTQQIFESIYSFIIDMLLNQSKS